MFFHDSDSLLPGRFIIIWEETPGISEASSCYHKSSEIFHFLHTISVIFAITITKDRNFDIFCEFFDRLPICISCVGLLIGSPMHSDQTCSCLFERLPEFYELFGSIPAEAGLHGDRNGEILCQDIHYLHRMIAIDHQSGAISAFDDLFCRAAHIDIDSLGTVGLDNFASREKYFWGISKYLKHERMLNGVVSEDSFCEQGIVMEPICTIKFRENDDISSRNFLTNPTEGAITVSIHGRESDDRFIF